MPLMSPKPAKDSPLPSSAQSMTASRVVIGRVTAPHGVRGQIRIVPLTDYPDRFYAMKSLDLYRDGTLAGSWPIRGISALTQRGQFIVALEGIHDMDSADRLRGCTIEIAPEDRVPLPENEFWISDLIGLEAQNESGDRLGTVKDIVENGGAQLILVTDDDGKEHLVPVVFFLAADLESRSVTLSLPEGLWEL